MAVFGYEGFRLAYEERGRRTGAAARPIVLIHGLLFARTHLYPLADALADRRNRVVLIDLLGHGESHRPAHARHYTMELFARQVIALLDHLDISEAAIGGTSLGANVAIEAAHRAPDRTRAIFVEMPVLERAAPAAALIFAPLTVALSLGAPFLRPAAHTFKRAPRGFGLYPDVLLDLLSQDPAAAAAVLHGLLTGRLAPHPDERAKMEVPALVIGHMRDVLHPLSDAEALSRELPNSEFVRATSFLELRFPPNRLSDRIAEFLDEAWSS